MMHVISDLWKNPKWPTGGTTKFGLGHFQHIKIMYHAISQESSVGSLWFLAHSYYCNHWWCTLFRISEKFQNGRLAGRRNLEFAIFEHAKIMYHTIAQESSVGSLWFLAYSYSNNHWWCMSFRIYEKIQNGRLAGRRNLDLVIFEPIKIMYHTIAQESLVGSLWFVAHSFCSSHWWCTSVPNSEKIQHGRLIESFFSVSRSCITP